MDKKEQIPDSKQQNIRHFLLMHNVNPTRQRLAIAACMFNKQQHLSAENILEQVNLDDIQVSKATVYNTLRLFVEQGMLREVVIDPLRTLFDTNITDHHHILNTETGEIRDIKAIEIDPDLVSGLAPGEHIQEIDLVLKVSNPE